MHEGDRRGGVTSPPPPPKLRIQIRWGILSQLFHRLTGATPGLPPLFLRLQLFVAGIVHLLTSHVLKQVDTPWHVVGTPETLRKFTSSMRR
jgi:hypothetical protein